MNTHTRFPFTSRSVLGAISIIAASLISASAAETVSAMPAMKPSGNSGTKPASVPTEKDFGAYLFAFHKDDDHSLHFALSPDGYTFTDVNRGKAVISGRDIAEQKGIRDPYITRGPDGAFYLGLTDLHIHAKREGLRDTEWERPGEKYDWGNNRALVLMKSFDLVNWTHVIYHVGEKFEKFKDVGCLWAPQMIFDPEKRRMMVTFTTRFGKGRNKLYYAYADPAFTQFEAEPQTLRLSTRLQHHRQRHHESRRSFPSLLRGARQARRHPAGGF